ncbi:putative disease resistance RPP13-like protein 1 [Rosa sericea]
MGASTIFGLVLSTGITSSVLQVAIQEAVDLVGRKIGRNSEIDNKLRKLRKTVLKIQSLVDDVEGKHSISNACRLLIEDCEGVLLDSHDLLDKIDLQLRNSGAIDPSSLESSIKEEVSLLLENVVDFFKEMECYFISEITKPRPPQTSAIPHGPSSLVDESCVVGMGNKKEEFIKLLLRNGDESNREHVSVIPIVGMGGIGKTTLAQLVYNDPKVVENFKLRMWVCVSLDYDLVKISKSIFESATNKVSELSNFNCLQMQLKEVMMKEKFLLVLDDMWNENPSDWDALKLLFRSAAPGSRVVVTTRSKTVSSIVTTTGDVCCLQESSVADCWEIIKLGLRTNIDSRADLKTIGLELAHKCKGLPLAAKVIGGVLRLKSKEMEWDALLKCDLWDLPEEKNHVYRVLKLSYDHLPAHLKRCFVYCSIIPRSQKIKVEDLIQIWAAEGFIQAQGARRIEDIGREYFDELCSRCLLQISRDDEVEMHDFIHDLARLVSTNLCLHLEDNMSRFLPTSTNVRYLSLLCQDTRLEVWADKLVVCYKYPKLRTFMLFPHLNQVPRNLFELEIFGKLFETFKWLRVLNLSRSGIRTVSDFIDRFIHLRYLNLSNTPITRLPASIVNLSVLETLQLKECPVLKSWPENMEKLIKLRHLHFDRYGQMSSMPQNLGKLTRLETLHTFTVKNEKGYEVGELQSLNCLRGSISIKDLENVANLQKAKDAMLDNKRYLDKLELHWGVTRVPTGETKLLDQSVLTGLEPHARLKELKVEGYHGSELPNWICKPSSVNAPSREIEKFVIDSCPELVNLPSIHHLTSLQKLEIHSCPKLQSLPVGGLPSSLESLNISGSGISKQQCEEGGSERENVKCIPEVEIDDQPIPTAPFPMP